jgi:hypothetical protein
VHGVIVGLAWALVALAGLAALVGGWSWWQVRASRAFWPLARAAQACAVALAAVSGVAALAGHEPDDGLYWVYALVPIVVGVVAEQVRIASAASVLAERGIEDTAEVGRMSEAQQRAIVESVLRRETGVMVLALVVTCFLAVRAVGTSAGF